MLSLEYLRTFRLGQYAIFDLTASFLGMALLSWPLSKLFLKIRVKIPKINWVFLTLPIGILTHLLVGKITPMTKNFLDLQGHYFLKLLIIGSFVLGMRGIKITKKSK